jgi:hypothetical protein
VEWVAGGATRSTARRSTERAVAPGSTLSASLLAERAVAPEAARSTARLTERAVAHLPVTDLAPRALAAA